MNDKFEFYFQVFISSVRSHSKQGKILLCLLVVVAMYITKTNVKVTHQGHCNVM